MRTVQETPKTFAGRHRNQYSHRQPRDSEEEYQRQETFLHRKKTALNEHVAFHFGADWEQRLKASQLSDSPSFDDTSPTFLFSKFFNQHPELFQEVLRMKKVSRQAEEEAMATVREHWEKQALKILVHCNLTRDAYQYLVNLLSHVWVEDDFVRVTLPAGTDMCLFPSKRFAFGEQAAMLKDMGLESTSVAAGVDIKPALQARIRWLWEQKLLDPEDLDMDIQILVDATTIFPSKRINGTLVVLKPIYDDSQASKEGQGVNSVHNCVMVCFYLRDDCLTYLIDIMENGLQIDGRTYNCRMPMGGDQKFLNSISALCGCSSTYPCLYCETTQDDLHLTKSQWTARGGMQLRSGMRTRRLAHIPEQQPYVCPAPKCRETISPDYEPPVPLEDMSDYLRRKMQREHFGVVPYTESWLPIDDPQWLIMDTLHNVLRVVPIIWRATVAANCTKDSLSNVANWVYETCKVIISSDVALQTPTGTKKLNMDAETWPGEVCQELLTNHEKILQMVFPGWEASQKVMYSRCLHVWQQFYYLTAVIGDGCEDTVEAREEYGAHLDSLGEKVVKAFIPVASATKFQSSSIYLHICGCHLGDLGRQWGSLTRWCAQGVEAGHQWIKFFSKHRCNKGSKAAQTILTKAVSKQKVTMANPASRGQQRQRAGGSGHLGKAKQEQRSKVKLEVVQKYAAKEQREKDKQQRKQKKQQEQETS